MKHLKLLFIAIFVFNINGFSQSDSEKIKSQKVKVIGHAHMDPVYRWRWNEIKNREIFKTFSDVLNSLDKYPDLKFAQSYLLYYSTIQNYLPDLFEEVQQSINNKKWSIVGGQWVEPDETMSSGESLIRQFLVAHDYYSKNLNIENVKIAWSPDVFTGHPGTLPKIYAGCGIENYVFSREAPEGKKVFWWESDDGSKILAYKIPDHYNPNFKNMPEYIKEWVETSKYDLPMITIGKGDHGGGPDDDDMRKLNMLANESSLEFEHISPEGYFQELHKSGTNWPVQREEFGYKQDNGRWMGCYTSQAAIKKLNRYFENQLIVAEKFSAIGTMHKGKPFYPREDFLEAWKILLFNQFHDILPGTLTGLGVNDVYKEYERLGQITSEQINAGLENIGNRINTEIDGIPVVVYNPHSWPVSQFVNAKIKFVKKPTEFSLKDPSGKDTPFLITEKSDDDLQYEICIDAANIPPMGYKVYAVVDGKPEKRNSGLKINGNQLENNFFKIQWNEKGITSIFSKKLQKEILKDYANKIQLLEDKGSSWSFGLTGKEFEVESLTPPEIVYDSPLKVVVKWDNYFQSSKFTQYMTLKANSDQIDFEMEIDWHSPGKLMRLIFPTNLTNGEAYFDQPYGFVKRSESDKEVPAQKWIDYSNNEFGVSLINNGKYGFTINEGILSMSVVRGAREMDPRMDEGIHSFKYSLLAHEGDWRNANIPQKAWEFNQPLIAKQETQHSGEISGWKFSDQSFPLEKSFFSINSDHVIVSSLKTKQDAYDPNPLILRIVETEGRDEDVTVHLPYPAVSVTECNHLEQAIELQREIKVEEKQFSFKMGHDQIRTFMIQF
ncbi:MAG: alpha-mannosidase [Prolixibacteraceae bacterium]|jgi:alpha-mannosidase|nr:alpha-mannosidase [Prolixibacteraceae bacterium]MBT6764910.1 alpha-mannosidase [Prolixibacteraceae bacterium]MBT7000433.1 alpha-mannosidase [Prolixibacteraceae bacterium]MBT7395800.1 alpha-mannosidase [Prolixibacteraceae bacterium]